MARKYISLKESRIEGAAEYRVADAESYNFFLEVLRDQKFRIDLLKGRLIQLLPSFEALLDLKAAKKLRQPKSRIKGFTPLSLHGLDMICPEDRS